MQYICFIFLESVFPNLCIVFLFFYFLLQCSLPESNVSGDQPPLSLGSTDEGSWIQVDENEAQPTLWVPDHAATNCAKCDSQFWMVNRKHHCRCDNHCIGSCCHRISVEILWALYSKQSSGGQGQGQLFGMFSLKGKALGLFYLELDMV